MSQKVIINIGVSGAGKSTWTRDWIKKHPNTVRINRDDLRKTVTGDPYLDGYYQQDKETLNKLEGIVSYLETKIMVVSLLRGCDVIIDNTNLKPSYIKEWINFLNNIKSSNSNFKLELYFNIFRENDPNILKKRVNVRDAPLGWDKLNYIDAQIKSLETIIPYIEENYKDQILANE